MPDFDSYKDKYRYITFRREDGILELKLHFEGGAPKWTFGPTGLHNELGWAFYDVGRDPENEVVIITHAGDSFMEALHFDQDFGSEPKDSFPINTVDRIYKEAKDLLINLFEIEVPVIGAVRGKAVIHAELATMSDIVLADSTAVFADKAHFIFGAVPGDGVHIWWQMVLGPTRGRYFLLTGEEIGAQEALRLGVVNEVLAPDALTDRAWALARELVKQPRIVRRYSRVALTQHIKRRILDELGYGLALENIGMMGR
jgi:enoyl-CoA hydratase/carnithine racemase